MSIVRSCVIGLTGAVALLAASLPTVWAADASTNPTNQAMPAPPKDAPAELKMIEVTGTRIRAPNMTSESPMTVVTNAEIEDQGATNIENVVNELPQVHTAQSDTTSNNGTGVANINLRGLGPTRTLVLIDGRRLGPGDPQGPDGTAADLNFIPAALVSGIDVLTGGASTAYGSDAIAGVVNFHLIRNFSGVQVTQTFNEAQHTQGGPANALLTSSPDLVKPTVPGDQFAGLISDTTVMLGSNLDDNRGNVTMYAEYRSTSGVLDGSRNFLACETDLNKAKDALFCGGSSSGEFGQFATNGGKTLALNPDGTATFVPFTAALKYNTAPANYLQRSDQRKSLGALAHERLSQWADVYGEVMFMDDFTSAQQAPGGLFFGHGPTGLIQIPCNNQFLSDAQEPSICQDAAGNPLPRYQAGGQPNVASIVLPSLRLVHYPRADELRHTDYRAVLGVRGDIGNGNWTYDVSGTYWDSQLSENFLNDVSYSKVQNALNGCTDPGSPGCVPLNIFQYGGVTPAMFAYIATPALKTGSSIESTMEGNVSGDFGAWGGNSPWAADPVAASFGVSERRDQLSFLPDNTLQINDLIGQNQAFPPVSGAESVTEEYGEIRIPIIEAKPFVKALNLDVAARHSNYTIGAHGGFSTSTFKFAADYAPTDDFRFRGSFNRAARAPNVYELFFPQSLNSQEGNSDPCSGTSPAASLAACAKTGVTPAQYGTIPDCPSTDCEALVGGNPAVQPEKADTYSFGLILTPRFLHNFEASIDYWAVRVNNYITTLPEAQIINGCLNQGIDSLCSLIHRGVDGVIFGSTGWVEQNNQNIGFLRNRGIDLELNYREDLENLGLPSMGSLLFKLNGTHLLEQTVATSVAQYDCAGLYGPTCSAGADNGPNFTWQHNARLTWVTPWKLDFSMRWRYLSSVSLDSNNSQPALKGGKNDAFDATIPAYSYMDLSASWKVLKHLTIHAGVNNVLDKDPPLLSHSVVYDNSGGGNVNTYTAYDVMGRVFFLTASAKF